VERLLKAMQDALDLAPLRQLQDIEPYNTHRYACDLGLAPGDEKLDTLEEAKVVGLNLSLVLALYRQVVGLATRVRKKISHDNMLSHFKEELATLMQDMIECVGNNVGGSGVVFDPLHHGAVRQAFWMADSSNPCLVSATLTRIQFELVACQQRINAMINAIFPPSIPTEFGTPITPVYSTLPQTPVFPPALGSTAVGPLALSPDEILSILTSDGRNTLLGVTPISSDIDLPSEGPASSPVRSERAIARWMRTDPAQASPLLTAALPKAFVEAVSTPWAEPLLNLAHFLT